LLSQHVLERPYRHDGGNAFVAALPSEVASKAAGSGYFALLQEDGVDLGPAESLHQTVRDVGKGAYSVWGDAIWFSSAANEDCEKNGRQYVIWLIETSEKSSLYKAVLDRAAKDEAFLDRVAKDDDATVLRTAARNVNRNNSVMKNFFGQRLSIGRWIEKTGMVIPRAMLEIGCGHIPWTGLRFLLEGTQRYVANDIMTVRKSFPAEELADLRSVCAWVEPRLLDRWSKVVGGGQSEIFPIGLEIRDGAGFETQSLNQDFDFTISVSVLEHVMDPEAVYRKLADVTRPRGWMFHSIDLRDHRFFDTDPLAFLRETEEQYGGVKTENRLRASDHRALFDRFGFEIIAEVDCVMVEGGSAVWTEKPFELRPWVTSAVRDQMDARYRNRDLLDLSTITIQLLCRKK
jgi:SAM-dependent methyltransferase